MTSISWMRLSRNKGGIYSLFKRNYVSSSSFKADDLQLSLCPAERLKMKPNVDLLVPGEVFTDHMLTVRWDIENDWGKPAITQLKRLYLHPAAKVFHYAIEVSEGMRAFRGVDGRIRLFRPQNYIQRLIDATNVIALPRFDGKEFLECLIKLVEIEKDWVPEPITSSLFAQTTIIGTEPTVGIKYSTEALLFTILTPSGPSFHNGFRPISVIADSHNIRSWSDGFGATKLGATYAPTVEILKEARERGFEQVLWLFGKDCLCTQLGDMNIFVDLKDREGRRQLVTPPLNDLILPGVTRQSLLELVHQWGGWTVVEQPISIHQLVEAHDEKRLLGFFAVGNSGLLSPVSDITFNGHRYHIGTMDNTLELIEQFIQTMADILHGKVDHRWALKID